MLAKKAKTDKKGLFNRFLVKLAAAFVILGCIMLVYTIEKDCAEKEREITVIQGKIDSYEVENADLQRILESDDMSDYIARVAIEERGYAYSDERRFYDTSRD